MKIKIFLTTILVNTIVTIFSQVNFSWKESELKGKIKKITESYYSYSDGQKKLETTTEMFYNEKGLGIKLITIHHQDSLSKMTFTGNVQKATNDVIVFGTYKDSALYTYDNDERLLTFNQYEANGVTELNNYKYSYNNIIEQQITCEKNNCQTKMITIKSDKNNTSTMFFGDNSKLERYTSWVENSNGKIEESTFCINNFKKQFSKFDKKTKIQTSEQYYDNSALIERYIVSYYDEDLKNVIKSEHYKSDKKTIVSIYYWKYDINGKLTEEKGCNNVGQLLYIETTTYNEKGFSFVRYDEDGKLNGRLNIIYEYDKLGNWVHETTFETENEIEGEKERIIEYY